MSDSTPEFKSEVEIPVVEGIAAKQFVNMGNYLMQGMNESEAALLAGINKTTIIVMRRSSENYNVFVEKKKLEFKRKHLSILATKADPKISQWLLERLNPEDFSSKNRREEVPQNVVSAIIKDIQQGNREGSELTFAYQNLKSDGNKKTQRTEGRKAESNIRKVLL